MRRKREGLTSDASYVRLMPFSSCTTCPSAPILENSSTAYEHIQLQIALELFSKMGAEGQVVHDENGMKRTYEASDVSPSLLRRIVPVVGSVMS